MAICKNAKICRATKNLPPIGAEIEMWYTAPLTEILSGKVPGKQFRVTPTNYESRLGGR
jgi:hypothetical protein